MEFFSRFKKKAPGHLSQPDKPTDKQVIGRLGEDSACDYLKKQGYRIIDRNYLKKWGEIDIVAQKAKKIHFVEVKSVSRTISTDKSVSPETFDTYRPEDNIHPWKLERLGRVIQSYLLEKDVSDDIEWQFDMATVCIDVQNKLSQVTLTEDLVL